MNYIFVKDYEYTNYTISASNKNRIRIFWKKIISQMPRELYKEVCSKPTNLVLQSKGEFDITGAIPYQFEAKGSSTELKEYLDQFAVFVEHDTNEIHKWREGMALIKQKILSEL